MKIKIKSNYKKILSDTYTPVNLYLKLRDKFSNALLLESSDYNKKQNSYSYICLSPIASFSFENQYIEVVFPNKNPEKIHLSEVKLSEAINNFVKTFEVESENLDFVSQGLFGYTTYDAIPMFNQIEFTNTPIDVPLIKYQYFRNILVFNHFNNELYLIENLLENESSSLDELESIINQGTFSQYKFALTDEEKSNFSDSEFLEKIKQAQHHCNIGDVFQVVVSRQFSNEFKGDEFNVYRALRSINPSPYLFYFDYGNYKIMGSSPEAQITINNQIATINPIAGTFRRTGNFAKDQNLAEELKQDPKENAEHVMLVDLARNDLSINSDKVEVKQYKTIEMYSHVIHLVSKVQAELRDNFNPIDIFFDTFPAGTLSGAPKHRAMQIIDELEKTSRGFYGGAIGIIGLDNSLNHAIFIRSMLSRNQKLTYQAGCGVVTKSNPESELQEIYNKLNAVKSAIKMAQNI